MYMTAPTQEELQKQKRYNDSVVKAQQEHEKKYAKFLTDSVSQTDSLKKIVADTTVSDSAKQIAVNKKFGAFANAISGTDENYTIENDFIKATISRKGGRISTVTLKNYVRHDSTPLVLFDADSSNFSLTLETDENQYETSQFYFDAVGSSFSVTADAQKSISMRLNAGDGKYLEYVYTLKGNAHTVDVAVNLVGMNNVLAGNIGQLNLNWGMHTPSQEFDHYNQRNRSTIYFKYTEDAPDYISEAASETKSLDAKTKWVAFKQQFFTSTLIANTHFDKTGADITSLNNSDSANYIKVFATNLAIPYEKKDMQTFGMQFYFGPVHYQTLKQYEGLNLEKQVPLGWGVFGWVNKFAVIPIFNWLDGFNLNYGLIILILTIIIKIVLFPIAYKTYLSSAKMRVLKPEIDEINKKFEGGDPLKKNAANMELYRKAGVNPLAGCIPLLLQMPILIALVSFFPSSIELRQQPFLWAHDLSTYDSVWNFGYVPVIASIYGEHMSLFALLMTASTLLYTWSNSQLMGNTNQMPGMKVMMYIMPFMFLFFLNKNSAGLSYYYFLANMITFGQTYLMRYFVDEKALRAKIDENKRNPKKKSSFQQRLEDMQRERMKVMQEKDKGKKKK